jgi:hypothetical protein
MIIQLKTRPLGFQVLVPVGDGERAVQAFAPMTTAAAQALVLALLAQPDVAGALAPDFMASLDEAVAERAQEARSDAEFLRAAGVATCD